MFNKMKIGSKILASYGAVIALLLVLGLVSWLGLRQVLGVTSRIIDARVPSYEAAAALNEANTDVQRVINGLAFRREAEARRQLYAEAADAQKRIEDAKKLWDSVPHSGKGKVAWDAASGPFETWLREALVVLESNRERDRLVEGGAPEAKSGQADPRLDALDGRLAVEMRKVREAYVAANEKLAPLLGTITTLVAEDGQEAHSAGTTATVMLLVAVLAIAAVLVLLGRSLAKDVSQVLKLVGDSLDRVAAGDLPEKLALDRGEDVNALRDSLDTVCTTLRSLLADMDRMSEEHARGDIDVVVDVKRYQGAYAKMAAGVNEMVGAHIGVKRKAIGVFAEFGRGNFDATMEPLPGKKRFVNETLDGVRDNLKGLVAEMTRMTAAHEKGDVDVALDAGTFQGGLPRHRPGRQRDGAAHIGRDASWPGLVDEFGSGDFEAPPELPRQEALHQRDRRAGAGQPEGARRRRRPALARRDRGAALRPRRASRHTATTAASCRASTRRSTRSSRRSRRRGRPRRAGGRRLAAAPTRPLPDRVAGPGGAESTGRWAC